MPSHIDMICRAREGSVGLCKIIQDFKKYVAKEIVAWIEQSAKQSRSDWLKVVLKYHTSQKQNKSTYQVWIQGNQLKLCEYPRFTLQKLLYIHDNPIKDQIVGQAEDDVYNSARDYDDVKGLMDIELIDFGVQEGYVF